MRVVKREVDPTSYNLEFYDDHYKDMPYIGTLKFSAKSQDGQALVSIIRDNEVMEFDYEEVRYLQMMRSR